MLLSHRKNTFANVPVTQQSLHSVIDPHGVEMPMSSKLIPYTQNRICLNLPEISSDKWSDFRREYEQGKTLKQIALEYHCDPRTVRKCLFLNQ